MDDSHFEKLLEESVRIHGHLCAGQVLGVKMSILGLKTIAIGDPKGSDRKNLMVFVEMDRCATDAIQSVTGCSLGKRTMKFLDYGKMAATFLNLKTHQAIRVIAREDIRDKAQTLAPAGENKYQAQLALYRVLPFEELFDRQEVQVDIPPQDLPGRPISRVQCARCAEYVQDMREIVVGSDILCRPCAVGAYYRKQQQA